MKLLLKIYDFIYIQFKKQNMKFKLKNTINLKNNMYKFII